MATTDDTSVPTKEVLDEEGSVDQKLKNLVIESRKRVDRVEEGVFIEAASDPRVQLSYPQQVAMYGMTVKQYLRNIEPLLQSDEIRNADEYYHNIDFGTVRFVPPDTKRREYTIVTQDLSDTELKQLLDLPRSAEVPEVKTEPITGLKDVIELPRQMTKRWSVITRDPGAVPQREYDTLERTEPIPKQTYTKAVRKANEFLHSAGVGMDVGMPEVDDENKPW